jgi:decaprenyl-phosphate phosphoribosyltransferase
VGRTEQIGRVAHSAANFRPNARYGLVLSPLRQPENRGKSVHSGVVPALALLRAMRPHQWIKNLVVFTAPLFALRLDGRTLLIASLACAAFTATSAATYLTNDVIDREADRRHPLKRHRPIAAGAISVSVAVVAACVCLLAGLTLAFWVTPLFGITVAAYAALQAAYTLGLKREPIVDLMVIATGFVLRAVGGAAATSVPMSGWFLVCLGFLALYLAIEKRKAEIRMSARQGVTRSVLRSYSLPALLRMESVVTASTVMSYGLWAIERTRSLWMLATIPLVAYGIFKYQLITEQGEGEEPERILFRHPELVATVVLWVVLSFLALRLGGGLR